MLKKIIQTIFGDDNQKTLKRCRQIVEKINQKEIELQSLSEKALKGKTQEFVERIKEGERPDDLLIEAYAVVKNACRRLDGQHFTLGKEEKTWNMIPYDCQLMGGIILHEGKIAEMKTGEGKTLVASLPLYLNALAKKGAHLVTVNDYLAERDAAWMGVLYNYLGLTVGTIVHGMSPKERQDAYAADITYGTNNEFGFDYLRDNMAHQLENRVQRPLHFTIVDEVDSILIDEARTPLIISSPAEQSTQKYYEYAKLINQLEEETHYVIDEKGRSATLTEEGIAKMESLLGVENIYTESGFAEVHHIEQALKAQAIFKKDTDYVLRDDEVVIVDEFTGRLMAGRRYSDGLHQAIEAKEGVEVKRESKTLATITFQNYFRLYKKLSGMTGTAKTEEEEFYKIYGLETIVVPTNKPVIRDDKTDMIFKNKRGKYNNLITTIRELHLKGQPVLVGTISVETSELISQMLKVNNVPHEVLNAKHHEREADIVANAGQKGAVTIATNMAGRGTDIKLGEGVENLGGLAILGTERHDSRRIDNQLRGRAGRQGDPGMSRFFVSMEDDLMRLFGSDRMVSVMDRIGFDENQPIENIIISRGIESSQKRVEGHNFDIRKHILEYDDVMNKHREIIYARRLKVLESEDLSEEIKEMMVSEARHIVTLHTSSENRAEWNMEAIVEAVNAILPKQDRALDAQDIEPLETSNDIIENIGNMFEADYQKKEASIPELSVLRRAEKRIFLMIIDRLWMEHIDQMTRLRSVVSLRGYGQRDPLMEYKQEAYGMFHKLLDSIQHNLINTLFKIQIRESAPTPMQNVPRTLQTNEDAIEGNLNESSLKKPRTVDGAIKTETTQPQVRKVGGRTIRMAPVQKNNLPKVGPNDPCSCGSGKKNKKCHGSI